MPVAEDIINICEMKYSSGKYALTKKDCEDIDNKPDAFKAVSQTAKSIHLTIVAANGLADNAYAHKAQNVLVVEICSMSSPLSALHTGMYMRITLIAFAESKKAVVVGRAVPASRREGRAPPRPHSRRFCNWLSCKATGYPQLSHFP